MNTNSEKIENIEKTDNIIEFRNVSFSYDLDGEERPILQDISFSVKRGSFVALLGKNGSGKSTIAKLMNMLIEPKSGNILIDGRDITEEMSDDEFFDTRRKIGMVFQNPDNQIVTSVVEEDIAFGPENLGVEPSEIRRRVDECMDTLGLSELARANPARLSGGQKQRVAIAGVLAMRPECMIFDESTAMLDPSGRREVMTMISKLNREKGITVILITHNMDEAAMAGRVMVISKNGIELDGSPREVFSNSKVISGLGLDLPQTTALLKKLKSSGFIVNEGITGEEECADEIFSLYKKLHENNR